MISTDPRQPLDPLRKFSELSVCPIDSQQILNPSRFLIFSRQQLNSFSICRDPLACIVFHLFCIFLLSCHPQHLISLHSCIYMDSLCPLDHLRSSLCFLGEALQFLVLFVDYDKKEEKMWFLFKFLHVKGRNTCLCKGELCFIQIGRAHV